MAKVIIVLTDKENGNIDLSAEYDPPMQPDEQKTPAQFLGDAFVNMMHREAGTGPMNVSSD